MVWSNVMVGSVFPFSQRRIVETATPISWANCSWVKPTSSLSFLKGELVEVHWFGFGRVIMITRFALRLEVKG